MRWYQDLSIRTKLQSIVMVTCAAALVVAAVLFTLYDRANFVREKTQDLIASAKMIGSNSTAALSFHDIRLAREILNALQAKPHVVNACIYDSDGTVFAKYSRSLNHVDFPPLLAILQSDVPLCSKIRLSEAFFSESFKLSPIQCSRSFQ